MQDGWLIIFSFHIPLDVRVAVAFFLNVIVIIRVVLIGQLPCSSFPSFVSWSCFTSFLIMPVLFGYALKGLLISCFILNCTQWCWTLKQRRQQEQIVCLVHETAPLETLACAWTTLTPSFNLIRVVLNYECCLTLSHLLKHAYSLCSFNSSQRYFVGYNSIILHKCVLFFLFVYLCCFLHLWGLWMICLYYNSLCTKGLIALDPLSLFCEPI